MAETFGRYNIFATLSGARPIRETVTPFILRAGRPRQYTAFLASMLTGGQTPCEVIRTKIYKLSEMDADHVSAWSKGGATTIENCQMLCKTHNRMKGNK